MVLSLKVARSIIKCSIRWLIGLTIFSAWKQIECVTALDVVLGNSIVYIQENKESQQQELVRNRVILFPSDNILVDDFISCMHSVWGCSTEQ